MRPIKEAIDANMAKVWPKADKTMVGRAALLERVIDYVVKVGTVVGEIEKCDHSDRFQ